MEISGPNGKTNKSIPWPDMLIFLTNFLIFFLFLGCVMSCSGFIHYRRMSHIANFHSISNSNMYNNSESALRIFFKNLIHVKSNNYGIKNLNQCMVL